MLLRSIRNDVRAWPGGQPLDDDAPEAFALLRDWIGHRPRAAQLLSIAESMAWTSAFGEELLDLLADWLADQISAASEVAYLNRAQAVETGRQGGKAKGARLTDAKKQALEFEARLSLPERPAPPKLIADALSEAGKRNTTPYRVRCDLADARRLLAESPSLRRQWAVELDRRLSLPQTSWQEAAIRRYLHIHASSGKAPIRARASGVAVDSLNRPFQR